MAKYLEKKAESLEKLNCSLASETARTTDFQNSGEFMEAHSLYYRFQITLLTYANSVHFFLTELQQT